MKKINEYMTVKQAAKFLGVTANTIRNWEKEGKIKVFRNPFNRYRLFLKEDLEEILDGINSPHSLGNGVRNNR